MQHARKPKMTIQSKVIIAAIIAIIAIIIGLVVHFHKPVETLEDETPTTTTVTTTTSITQPEEDVSAIVAQLVESEVAKLLTETTTAPVTEAKTAEDTSAVVTTTHVSEETVEETALALTAEEDTTPDESLTLDVSNFNATLVHNSSSYELLICNSSDEAKENAFHIPESGRNVDVFLDSASINDICISSSYFLPEEDTFSAYEVNELEVFHSETRTMLFYEIPDSPYGNPYGNDVNVIMLFTIENESGNLYFAITY